MKKPNKVILRL
jgi:glucokinase